MTSETELKELVAEVLHVAAEEIDDDASPITLPSWDSLNHLNLIVAIEERLGVSFTTPEVSDIASFADIKAALKRKGMDFRREAGG